MLEGIPKDTDAIAEEDVTLVACMLGQMSAGPSYLGETASVSNVVNKLCLRLQRFKIPLILVMSLL
jgi:hypothetical protein